MRTFITLLFISLFSATATAQDFKFENEIIEYGRIPQSTDGKRVFEFTNIGDQPLIITKVISSCGCTIPKKPEKPIMPGEKGEIEVSYDTRRVGGFSKSITVVSNAKEERKVLKIKGYITREVLPEKATSILSGS